MGRRDLYQTSVGYNYPMYFQKRNEEYNEAASYEYESEKIGPIYCKIYTAMTRAKDSIDMQFQFDRDNTTIKVLDDISDMHAGDKVYMEGKEWLVDNIQSKPYQNNSEFDTEPSKSYYVSLRGA